jgi:hypothetical protein
MDDRTVDRGERAPAALPNGSLRVVAKGTKKDEAGL